MSVSFTLASIEQPIADSLREQKGAGLEPVFNRDEGGCRASRNSEWEIIPWVTFSAFHFLSLESFYFSLVVFSSVACSDLS